VRLRRTVLFQIVLTVTGVFLFSAESSQRGSSASKPPASAAKKPPSSQASKKPAPPKRTTTSWRRGQQEPTPERYREIQQALVGRGYLEPPATGKWGEDSVEALKKFQEDQNLHVSGRITALSLIALGLGPKRESAEQSPSPASSPSDTEP
jgi:hypothetical protein